MLCESIFSTRADRRDGLEVCNIDLNTPNKHLVNGSQRVIFKCEDGNRFNSPPP
jgi:hypothetical protein